MTEQIFDVFISYAHVDDVKPADSPIGWVTRFVSELQKLLNQNLGRNDVKIWKDESLAINDKVTGTLVDEINRSRTIVLFMSRGYSHFKWCQMELGKFLEHNKAHKNKESVFIVELAPTDRENWHPRLQELPAIKFYREDEYQVPQLFGMPTPKPEDEFYWKNLVRLTHSIAKHLESCPDIESPGKSISVTAQPDKSNPDELKTLPPDSPLKKTKSTVWIAEPTIDLIDEWESLAESIRQAGYKLLPLGPETYPRSSEAKFCEKFRDDLEYSQLYIQLLGKRADRKPEDGDVSFTALQSNFAKEIAKQRQIPFLQWRSKELTLESISDKPYRQLLTGAIACGFEEFRQRVLTTLQELNENKGETPARSLAICINADKSDLDLARRVKQILFDLDADAFIAPAQAPGQLASDFSKQLDEVIRGSEGVIFIYGQSLPTWVVSQFQLARKALLTQQRKGIWGALLDGPPPPDDKLDVDIASKNLMTLNCRDGEERQLIEQFVNALREACHA